jgi:hypothetical protein
MIIQDVRRRAPNGDIILVGHCERTIVESDTKYLVVRKPVKLTVTPPPETVGPIETYSVPVFPYVGRLGGYLLVQPEHDCSWIPGWRPV